MSHILQEAIGWTLVHSIWQASLIALCMSVVLRYIDDRKSNLRYAITVFSLITVAISSISTFVYYYAQDVSIVESTFLGSTSLNETSLIASFNDQLNSFFNANLEIINSVWLLGFVLFVIRFLFSVGYVQFLRKIGVEYDDSLNSKLSRITRAYAANKKILIAHSQYVSIPMVLGHIKPIILFPIGIVNALTDEEVEAIIAHEVAHVLRNDFLTNIILTLVESLYYYHPAVWWISANIKAERENCCDDKAMKLAYKNTTYAKALVKLSEFKNKRIPTLAMPLASNKGQLLNRIKRLLNMPQNRNDMREKSIASILMLTMLVIFTSANTKSLMDKTYEDKLSMTLDRIEIAEAIPSALPKALKRIEDKIKIASPRTPLENLPLLSDRSFIVRDTFPNNSSSQSRMTIITNDDGKSIEMEKSNGKITKLKIDGKEIPESDYGKYEDITGRYHTYVFPSEKDWDGAFDNLNWFEGNTILDDSTFMHSFGKIFDGKKWHDLEHQFEGMDEMNEDLFEQLRDLGGSMYFNFDGQNFNHMFKGLDSLGSDMRIFQWDGNDLLFPEGLDDNFWDGNHNEFVFPSGGNKTVVDHIGATLNRDGLLMPYKSNKIELTGKHLKINGEKMPKAIFEKYKNIYQEKTGAPLTKGSKMVFEIEGQKSKRRVRTF